MSIPSLMQKCLDCLPLQHLEAETHKDPRILSIVLKAFKTQSSEWQKNHVSLYEKLTQISCEHFLTAFENCDLEDMRLYIQSIDRVDSEAFPHLNHDKLSPLQYACRRGDKDLALALIEKGADIHAKDPTDASHALNFACEGKNEELCLELIARGAEIDCINIEKHSTLYLACSYELPNVVKKLLEKGAPVNPKAPQHQSLLFATECQEILRLLIQAGADPLMIDPTRGGHTPFHAFCRLGFIDIVRELLEKKIVDPNVEDADGCTPLITALYSEEKIKIIDLLLQNGANPNHRNHRGETAIFSPLDATLLEKLIDAGADVNAQNNEGETPLFHVLGKKRVDILIQHKADIHIVSKNGQTALHANPDNGLRLIELGARSDLPDNEGNTPLHIACLRGLPKLAFKLLELKVPFDTKNKQGQTPLLLSFLVQFPDDKIPKTLIEMGADIHIQDKDDSTLLHLVRKNWLRIWVDLALILIQKGVDVSIRNKQGITALQVTVFEKKYEEFDKKFISEILKDYPFIAEFLSLHDNGLYAYLHSALDKLLESQNPLEIPFLLGDSSLAHKISIQIPPQAHVDAIRAKYPKSPVQWLLESIYEISSAHYATHHAHAAEIPSAPPEELLLEECCKATLQLFDAINFTDPTQAAYVDPSKLRDDGSAITIAKLKSNLQDLMTHLQKRDIFLAVPEEEKEKTAYYDKLETLIRWAILGLLKLPKEEEIVRAGTLIPLAVACGHCGTRYMDGAKEAYSKTAQTPTDQEINLETKLSLILQGLREFSFHQMLQFEDNVHESMFYLWLIGKERGIPHAEGSYRDPIWTSEETQEEGLRRFNNVHTPNAIIDRIQEAIQGNEIDFFRYLQNWLQENAPKNWMPAQELLKVLNDALCLDEDDIKLDPKARGDAYLYSLTDVTVTPQRLKKEAHRQVALDLLTHYKHLKMPH